MAAGKGRRRGPAGTRGGTPNVDRWYGRRQRLSPSTAVESKSMPLDGSTASRGQWKAPAGAMVAMPGRWAVHRPSPSASSAGPTHSPSPYELPKTSASLPTLAMGGRGPYALAEALSPRSGFDPQPGRGARQAMDRKAKGYVAGKFNSDRIGRVEVSSLTEALRADG